LHISTVKSALASLVAKQWLTVTRRGKLPKPGEKRLSNVYAAIYPEHLGGLGALGDQSAGSGSVGETTTSSPERDDWVPWTQRLGALGDSISYERHIELANEFLSEEEQEELYGYGSGPLSDELNAKLERIHEANAALMEAAS
jgi:hypothetical protein